MKRWQWIVLAAMTLASLALVLPVFTVPAGSLRVSRPEQPPRPAARPAAAPQDAFPDEPDPPRRVATPPVRPKVEEPPPRPVPEPESPHFAGQTQQDRVLLGAEAFAEMEQLWQRAERSTSADDAIVALGELVRRFPDSFRAGCAVLRLGALHAQDPQRPEGERRQSAEAALRVAMTQYGQSRCGHDASVRHMAELLLATEVYAARDPDRAEEILENLSVLPSRELDDSGTPLAERAVVQLNQLPETPPLARGKTWRTTRPGEPSPAPAPP